MPIKHEWNGTILTITSDSGTSSADLQGVKGATGARGARGLTGRTGGGALIEDGVIRDDTTWSSAGIMDRFAEAFSTEGNPVVCNNALANVPFNIITEFDVKQEGSGNPYPAGGGKNLFDKNNYTPLALYINCDTKTYISYTDERTVVIPIKPNTTYTVKKSTSTVLRLATSIDFPTKNGVITSCVRYDDDGKRADALTITSGSNDKWLAVQLFADSSKDTEYYSIPANIGDLQVEEGSIATAYEPYSNIRPIVGYDAINIARSGKNLLNMTYKNSVPSTSNGMDTTAAIGWSSGFIPINKECVLTLYEAIPSGEFYLLLYKEDKSYIGSYGIANQAGSITSTMITGYENAKYCRVRLSGDGAKADIKYKMQLEYGLTATDYEPYKGETFTLSLGNTYAQGVLDWNTGELVVDKTCIVFNGTENINLHTNYNNTGTNRFNYPNTPPAIMSGVGGLCSHMTYGVAPIGSNEINNRVCGWKNGGLYWRFDSCATKEEMKAYMTEQYNAGTPIQVVYELAEPQTIKLEPQTIKALSGTNTLLTNADNIQLVGRYDAMKTIQELLARVSALEAKVGE